MKKKLTPQEIEALHVQYDEAIDSAALNGDYKTNNREFRRLDKLFRITSEDMDLAMAVYKNLLTRACVTTRISSSAECLKLGIYVDKAVEVLEELSKRTDIGIRRLNAEMVLRVWRGDFPGKTL